jgi:hypothetical protein
MRPLPMKGFSPRNLKYMRSFAAAWLDPTFVQQVAAQIDWAITKCFWRGYQPHGNADGMRAARRSTAGAAMSSSTKSMRASSSARAPSSQLRIDPAAREVGTRAAADPDPLAPAHREHPRRDVVVAAEGQGVRLEGGQGVGSAGRARAVDDDTDAARARAAAHLHPSRRPPTGHVVRAAVDAAALPLALRRSAAEAAIVVGTCERPLSPLPTFSAAQRTVKFQGVAAVGSPPGPNGCSLGRGRRESTSCGRSRALNSKASPSRGRRMTGSVHPRAQRPVTSQGTNRPQDCLSRAPPPSLAGRALSIHFTAPVTRHARHPQVPTAARPRMQPVPGPAR